MRLVKEVLAEVQEVPHGQVARPGPTIRHMQTGAIQCLQEASEAYIVELLRQAYAITTHRHSPKARAHTTLTVEDLRLALRIGGGGCNQQGSENFIRGFCFSKF